MKRRTGVTPYDIVLRTDEFAARKALIDGRLKALERAGLTKRAGMTVRKKKGVAKPAATAKKAVTGVKGVIRSEIVQLVGKKMSVPSVWHVLDFAFINELRVVTVRSIKEVTCRVTFDKKKGLYHLDIDENTLPRPVFEVARQYGYYVVGYTDDIPNSEFYNRISFAKLPDKVEAESTPVSRSVCSKCHFSHDESGCIIL